jgi:CRISPR system Cascade subunit CasC
VFDSALKEHLGIRTKQMGVEIYNKLREKGVIEEPALDAAKKIAEVFGKLKKEDKDNLLKGLEIEQLTHFSPEEQVLIDVLIEKLTKGNKLDDDDLKLMQKKHTAADIALFGRMLASSPAFNTEAAAQVAHAITVHKVTVEDDFFTAVDDLNKGEEDLGAGHMGEAEFAAGLFYLYLCIDSQLLLENLNGDVNLAKTTLAALLEAAATVAPSGKQNSFGSRVRASYILAEKGTQQPRSLSVAFLKPVYGEDLLNVSIEALDKATQNMDKVYGLCRDAALAMNAETGEGSLRELTGFITDVYHD